MKTLNIKRLVNAKTHIEVAIAELELLADKNKGIDWGMVGSANSYIKNLQELLSSDNGEAGIEALIKQLSQKSE